MASNGHAGYRYFADVLTKFEELGELPLYLLIYLTMW